MNVIITGASGMVGRGVLLECLDSPKVYKVLSIGRSKTGLSHEKLSEIIHDDFTNIESIKDQLAGYDSCFYCMGVSASGLKEDTYRRLTYDYAMGLAQLLVKLNPQMTFVYVSGQGTDSTEKGRAMWARVKGKTENDLMSLGFNQSFMFRPGGIIPLRGIKSKTPLYQFFLDYFLWLLKLIKFLFPKSVVNTTDIGLAMINISEKGYSEKIINPRDILKLA